MSEDPFREDRVRMVRLQLQRRGIIDPRVLQAMEEVPRHRFVPPEYQHLAYQDSPLSIGEGQTISQPYMVALMTQVLQPQLWEKVLEIGTGSGYQAAVLSRLACRVYTVERFPQLAQRAEEILRELGCANVDVVVANGSLGLPERAPFDGIVVTAGAPQVPLQLLDQLAEGGRLVIPIGDRSNQVLYQIVRHHGRFTRNALIDCVFVPLIGLEAWADIGKPNEREGYGAKD
ncbi:MAG: protein-L-isoaspartate(D-aspartate) O-methyltransferase [Candidatus Tectomicrobia bacterium]|uniref:Protein-L-isoaspartate O-methyltransferase n=1 Tax=Tectimicrobiota bacterium TaxID=2528274 RepID=A0A932G1Y4_UNCTE|nr:protein-L-isoaspartate(D-aspartate) O-methyltransferase [Candidatus Tectomicrobia bacterium]